MSEACSSCGAPIEWARTTKGARIPLDPEPSEAGNIRLEAGVAIIVGKGQGDRISHFATCRDAAKFRRHPSGRR